MTDAERDEALGGVRPLVRGALWCAGGAGGAVVALYAAFWLPYREPEDPPYPVPILPQPPARPALTGAEPAHGYEWADRDKGTVRIPIEDAMRITAGRLPVRKQPGAADRAAEPPTDAGSGRAPPPRPR